ncbi:chemotaxis protein CheB [Desulfogranum japonicum]|uniref:chemotaxis protein CheB n=1 Tax=Desulfogranum japonicum TaxID=231447 RepID=UPI000A07BC3C|nr:chemotaxis protein CheB [Desulfogranum japonicum]
MPPKKPTPQKNNSLKVNDTNSPRLDSPVADKTTMMANILETKKIPIIGLGASAGGLDALKAFFSEVPADCGMAFIIVVHLTPDQPTMLPELLEHSTPLPVEIAKDNAPVEVNHAYVIPPGKDLALFSGKIQLLESSHHIPHLPVDFFLKSLAQDQGNMAAAIILSGTGTDGTRGLREIKAANGLTLAQDIQSAGYDGMPRSAVSTGLVDMILAPQNMYLRLRQYFTLTSRTNQQQADFDSEYIPSDWLNKIYAILRNQIGYDFSMYKTNTISRRISRRMGLNQIACIKDYTRHLQENSSEVDALFRELLIGVTSFFRDPGSFDMLREKVLHALFAEMEENTIFRAWVPGCSTGEEAYSLAILLHEFLNSHPKRISLQIFGTDLAGFSIDKAREGYFPESISLDVSPERLKRFFIKEAQGYRIRKEIRESIIFSVQNVLKDPPFSKLNLVCCRNVLIYFNTEAQKRLLPLFHYTLLPNGILMLGSSESIGGYTNLFETLDHKWKIFRRKEVPEPLRQQIDFPAGSQTREQPRTRASVPTPSTNNMIQVTQKAILDQFAPTAVLIERDGTILYNHGRVGMYLEPPSGPPTLNILNQARKGLGIELSSALRAANVSGKCILRKNVAVQTNDDVKMINLHVCPQKAPKELTGRFLVVFEDIPSPPANANTDQKESMAGVARIAELEKELQFTRENHQTTVEELESSNEELKSTNEELQSSNEELQSSNEELESSREELQSLNEEVQTVNAELQSKLEELSLIYDDMRNLLNSIEVATIFVDIDMRVRRFTPEATTIVNLIETDIGRPLEHVATNISYDGMITDIEEVLENLTTKEREVQTMNGTWYNMRIIPYRTTDNRIIGAVLTFVCIDDQKKNQEQLTLLARKEANSQEIVRKVFDMNTASLAVVDDTGKIIIANTVFSNIFGVAQEDLESKSLFSLKGNIFKHADLLAHLTEACAKRQDFVLKNVRLYTPKGQMQTTITGRIIHNIEKKPNWTLLSFTKGKVVKKSSGE